MFRALLAHPQALPSFQISVTAYRAIWCDSGNLNLHFKILKSRSSVSFNPLTPELNPSAQRCLTIFLVGILLFVLCIYLIYARNPNKCNIYSFSLLIMYGSSYTFRHYIDIFRNRS
jgi:hypothetical protein